MQTVAGSVAIAFLPNTTATSTGGTGGATVATPGNGGDVAVPDVEHGRLISVIFCLLRSLSRHHLPDPDGVT